MTLEDKIKVCKICQNSTIHFKEGIICDLTKKKPTFEENCPDFLKDDIMANSVKNSTKVTSIQKYNNSRIVNRVNGQLIAKRSIRLIHLFIDGMIISLIQGLFLALLPYLLAPISFDFIFENYNLITFFISLSIYLSYYIILEYKFGKTIAKMMTNTKVVNEDETKIPLLDILVRTIVRYIPFEIFSFLGDSARGWHDRWSNTYVVQLNDK